MTKINYNNIPVELKTLPNWVGFKVWWEEKEGKWKKMPVDILATVAARKDDPFAWKDIPASSTNAKTWTDFETAVKWITAKKPHKKYKWHLGFAFDGSGIVRIDLDKCVGDDGEVSDFASGILSEIQSYTEYSPSGKGLHVLARCSEALGGSGINRQEIEIYSSGRFFTMTGARFENAPSTINDCTQSIISVYSRYNNAPEGTCRAVSDDNEGGDTLLGLNNAAAVKATNAAGSATQLSDNDIIEKARASKSGAKFEALWRGDISGYKSHSEADLALCSQLAFWAADDASQMDRLFRTSGLCRKKWDERHGGQTYGEKTIAQVLAFPHEVYKPPSPKEKKKKAKTQTASSVFVRNNCYYISRGDGEKMLTNFIVEPLEIVATEDASHITAKLITEQERTTVRTFKISDFNSVSLFRDATCKNDMDKIVTCSDTELQFIKDYISRLPCIVKQGYKGVGIEFVVPKDGGVLSPVFVCKEGAFGKDWVQNHDIVQVKGSENIPCNIAEALALDNADLEYCGKYFVDYNEKPKTISILCFAAACFIKPHLKHHGIKFPNLILYGEHGSGKSTTYKQFLSPFFSTGGAPPIAKMTGFTFLSKAASSNCIPMAYDEYKPSTLSKWIANEIHCSMRDIYDGEHGERGKADQTVRQYKLDAPLIVLGEECPHEPAIRERSIILQFSKADISDKKAAVKMLEQLQAVNAVYGKAMTQSFGKTVLLTALGLSSHKVKAAYDEALVAIKENLDPRVINNIAVLMTGAWLLQQTCLRLGTTFEAAFSVERSDVMPNIIKAVKDYTLDGSDNSKGVVENSLEVMDRMVPQVLKSGVHFRLTGKNLIAINLKKIYDEFTKYIKDKAIQGEYVDYNNFKAQLKKKSYFAKYASIRFKADEYSSESGQQGCYELDILKLNEFCDISNMLAELKWLPPQPVQGSIFDEAS